LARGSADQVQERLLGRREQPPRFGVGVGGDHVHADDTRTARSSAADGLKFDR
jgi:hypothetical protein